MLEVWFMRIFHASIAIFSLVLSTCISQQQLSIEHIETIKGLEKAAEVGISPVDALQEA